MTARLSVPLARPDLRGREAEYVAEAMASTWIGSTGPYLDRFVAEFAATCNVNRALGVSNGTVALHLALLALDVRPGDEVLVPSLTYVATANAVRYVGAEPVFVDVDPGTWCIDPQQLEGSISRRTKGIIPVHLYGHPADMDAINHVAAVHGLWVVEDAAEAPFARYKGRPTGGLGKIGTFSFYGNKVITSGEGGAVTVNDDDLATRLSTLRGQGVDPSRRYFFPVVGYNFRMTNIAAAILCAQLERKTEILEARRAIYDFYNGSFGQDKRLVLQRTDPGCEVSPWLYPLLLAPDYSANQRDELLRQLALQGVETRPFFIPVHSLPPYRVQATQRGEVLPATDALSSRGFNLPTFSAMTPDEMQYVARALTSCLDRL